MSVLTFFLEVNNISHIPSISHLLYLSCTNVELTNTTCNVSHCLILCIFFGGMLSMDIFWRFIKNSDFFHAWLVQLMEKYGCDVAVFTPPLIDWLIEYYLTLHSPWRAKTCNHLWRTSKFKCMLSTFVPWLGTSFIHSSHRLRQILVHVTLYSIDHPDFSSHDERKKCWR